MGIELLQLDAAVWDVRRYCKVLNYEFQTLGGERKPALPLELERIENSENRPPQHLRLIGGLLERILDDKKHPARRALIWNNLFFGGRRRQRIKWRPYMHATNSPLSLHPEILDDVLKLVHMPGDVKQHYREVLAESLKDATTKRLE